MKEQEHRDSVYGHKAADAVSWYRPHLDRSIALIDQARLGKDAKIVDVGGGVDPWSLLQVEELIMSGHL